MYLALPHQRSSRLHAEPIAELSGVVAYNKPTWQTEKHATRKTHLPRHPGSQSLLHYTRSIPSQTTTTTTTSATRSTGSNGCNNGSSHERTLEMLRSVLCSAKSLLPSDLDAETCRPEAKIAVLQNKPAGLEAHRAAFVEALRELQLPGAESIAAINALLCNRVKLGLLDAVKASNYRTLAARPTSAGSALGVSIVTFADVDDEQLRANSNISSSLNSTESSETLASDDADASAADDAGTAELLYSMDGNSSSSSSSSESQPVLSTKSSLIEMWATSGFWRGVSTRAWSGTSFIQERRNVSISSGSTLTASVSDGDAENDTASNSNSNSNSQPPAEAEAAGAVPPMADELGVCWPLDEASSERAGSWGHFYAQLGDVRVPTRFRTPHQSLVMLATEQSMMASDKIVCPLKNRLQEPNPRRQLFEDHIRETGLLPPPLPTGTNRPRSPLCNQL
ncbi:hypothetical protein GGH99_000341 [Coemansia sp. RSA 1285]|nr:hypothetical protein GGH99_000341 [Coemansia sp. RSA 1285]